MTNPDEYERRAREFIFNALSQRRARLADLLRGVCAEKDARITQLEERIAKLAGNLGSLSDRDLILEAGRYADEMKRRGLVK